MKTMAWRSVLVVVALGCASATKRPATPDTVASAPVDTQPRAAEAAPAATGMVVRVDARVELLGILFRLAGAEEYNMAGKTAYAADVDRHFAAWRGHPAVVATRQLRETAGVGFDAPMSLAVYLDEGFRPRRALAPRPPHLDERWAKAPLDDYLAKVRDFAERSRLREFLAAHRSYYTAVEDRFRGLVAKNDVVSWFDGFFGRRPGARYVVVPGLLNGPSNYGAQAQLLDGSEELYQVVCLEHLDEQGLPRPGETTLELLVHEMAHSYVNPIFERHLAELEPAMSRLFALVEQPMSKQAYGTWQTVAYESGVRAVTILFLRDRRGPERAGRMIEDERYNSFYWVGELAELLDRERGHFEAALPRMTALFQSVANRYANGLPRLPFRGPINAVHEDVVVVPRGQLAGYVGQIFDHPAPAEQKQWKEVTHQALILYGSPATNRLVAHVLAASGWTVTKTGITVAGRHFDGPGLVLVACRPHPDDASKGVLVYTSARDEDLVGINGLFHGPTDWLVARRTGKDSFTPVASGSFEKTENGWRY